MSRDITVITGFLTFLHIKSNPDTIMRISIFIISLTVRVKLRMHIFEFTRIFSYQFVIDFRSLPQRKTAILLF